MCCPEMNVGMLFYGVMDDDSVILTHNCRRFSQYTGYLTTFKYAGPVTPAGPILDFAKDDPGFRNQSIITIDAVMEKHYHYKHNLRDTKKAYLGWRGVREWYARHNTSNHTGEISTSSSIHISTGRWGCGAFGGQVLHKYMQQLVALGLANRDYSRDENHSTEDSKLMPKLKLSFSSFGDPATLSALRQLQGELGLDEHGSSPLDMGTLFKHVVLPGYGWDWHTQNVDELVTKIEKVKRGDLTPGGVWGVLYACRRRASGY